MWIPLLDTVIDGHSEIPRLLLKFIALLRPVPLILLSSKKIS
jgi:hypothetical protein